MNFKDISRDLEQLFDTNNNRMSNPYGFEIVSPNTNSNLDSDEITAEVQTYISASEKITNSTYQTTASLIILCRAPLDEGIYDLLEKVQLVIEDFRRMPPEPISGLTFVDMISGPGFPTEAQYVFPLQFTYNFLESA